VEEDDVVWFEKTIRRLGEEEFGGPLNACMQKIHYFADFLRSFHVEI
jgi:hypothetical protein